MLLPFWKNELNVWEVGTVRAAAVRSLPDQLVDPAKI